MVETTYLIRIKLPPSHQANVAFHMVQTVLIYRSKTALDSMFVEDWTVFSGIEAHSDARDTSSLPAVFFSGSDLGIRFGSEVTLFVVRQITDELQ
jgi:hypothetical protein